MQSQTILEKKKSQVTYTYAKHTAVYCHVAYLNYIQHIMWNGRLDEAQTRIKIAWRNINNLRYVDDTTLMAESKECPGC